MNTKFRILFLVMASALLLASCKKEEEKTKNYLGGQLKAGKSSYMLDIDNPEIVMYPSGIYHPDGKKLGCYTYLSGVDGTNDTLYRADSETPFVSGMVVKRAGKADKKHGFPDSLATYTLYTVIYPEDTDNYYVSSVSSSVTLLDKNKSVPEIAFDSRSPWFEDARDGRKYNYFVIDNNLDWMAHNLAFAGSADGSVKYGVAYCESEMASNIMGRMYSYDHAVKACPEGWRLPTDAEWKSMVQKLSGKTFDGEYQDFIGGSAVLMVDASLNGTKMWEFWPDVKIPGVFEAVFKSIPMGFANMANPVKFDISYEYAGYWTADSCSEDMAYYRYLYWKENSLKIGKGDKASLAMNVRCVRAHQD